MIQMLSEALRFENGERIPWQTILRDERSSRFLEGWGRPGDIGVVGVDESGKLLGTAWLRDFPTHGPEWGDSENLNEITRTELIVAVDEQYRGRGIGRLLMTQAP